MLENAKTKELTHGQRIYKAPIPGYLCGSIAKGKREVLVLLSDNPYKEINNVAKVRAVFKQGELISKAEDFSIAI